MTTDFRALCAELMKALDEAAPGINQFRDLRDRAGAALAEEPAVPEGREPTVMETVKLSSEIEAAGLGQVDFARAVLARCGTPNLAEPRRLLGDEPAAPAPPADDEGLSNEELWEIYQGDRGTFCPIEFARDVIAADRSRRQAPPADGEVNE